MSLRGLVMTSDVEGVVTALFFDAHAVRIHQRAVQTLHLLTSQASENRYRAIGNTIRDFAVYVFAYSYVSCFG
jgi:hypothetical protein